MKELNFFFMYNKKKIIIITQISIMNCFLEIMCIHYVFVFDKMYIKGINL